MGLVFRGRGITLRRFDWRSIPRRGWLFDLRAGTVVREILGRLSLVDIDYRKLEPRDFFRRRKRSIASNQNGMLAGAVAIGIDPIVHVPADVVIQLGKCNQRIIRSREQEPRYLSIVL